VLLSHPSAIAAPKQPASTLAITNLRLQNFRNYSGCHLALGGLASSGGRSSSVVLVGANGAGKTNMLEALSLLAPGRGLRRAKADLLSRQSAPSNEGGTLKNAEGAIWSIAAELETTDGPLRLGTGTMLQDDGAAGRRIIKINGEFSSQSVLAEHLAVSWLTPDMDGVLAAAASERRRFLDRLVIAFDPAHSGRIQRYEKAYRQRNRLMEEGQQDQSWYEALEQQMAESGMAIIAARQAMVDALDIEAAMPLPSFPSARLRLDGDVETWLATMPAVDAEDRIKSEAKANRLNGNTTMPGPMNTVLTVSHSKTGQNAELSSTGEQKALVISVILAHARLQSKRLKRPQLLLLDDIVSHLDEARRRTLFELTADFAGQVWFSGTDAEAFATMQNDHDIVFIEDGDVVDLPSPTAAVRSSS